MGELNQCQDEPQNYLENPIIILTCPRSGSSLTSGLFHLHGVWVGTCRSGDTINPKGFFENNLFKSRLKTYYTGDLSKGPFTGHPEWKNETKRILAQEGYKSGPWLVKHSALYWNTWMDFSPFWIKVRRNIDSVVKSCIDVGFYRGRYDKPMLYRIMERHNEEMDKLDGVDVFTEELIKGDYSSLEQALSHCGLKMDADKVNDFIEPSYWHY